MDSERDGSGYFVAGWRKLSRRLARYYLAIALFQSPLSERSVTVSVSLRSPAVKLVASRRQVTRSATLALRISRTAWLLNADHLCPFALWTTFSSSLVSRHPHDYYGHSVSQRSPSLGNPVFRHDETYRASCRCLTHHLHETSLVPIPSARIPRTATSF